MKRYARSARTALVAGGLILMIGGVACAQQPGQAQGQQFRAGTPLGTIVDGQFEAMSSNVKVYGAVVNAESCSYDPERDLIVVVNRGVGQDVAQNDAFISLLNHDGSVHTSLWIGATRAGLTLNQPLGSEVKNGRLYVADRDGGTSVDDPSVSVVRWFNMRDGSPMGEIRIEGQTGFNDIAVADDWTVYGTQTGTDDAARIYRVNQDGTSSVFLKGAPLNAPNGIAFDNEGNLVVVNAGDTGVLTYSTNGRLLRSEQAAQPGSDGIVVMPDGTKYVSSVRVGGVSRIRPGQAAELIATSIPNAASMCLDAGANQLVIPLSPNNSVAIVPLD